MQEINWLTKPRKPKRKVVKVKMPFFTLYKTLFDAQGNPKVKGMMSINAVGVSALKRDGVLLNIAQSTEKCGRWMVNIGTDSNNIYVTEGFTSIFTIDIRKNTPGASSALDSLREWADANISTETLRFKYQGAVDGVARFELYSGDEDVVTPDVYRIVDSENKVLHDYIEPKDVLTLAFSKNLKKPFQLLKADHMEHDMVIFKPILLSQFCLAVQGK